MSLSRCRYFAVLATHFSNRSGPARRWAMRASFYLVLLCILSGGRERREGSGKGRSLLSTPNLLSSFSFFRSGQASGRGLVSWTGGCGLTPVKTFSVENLGPTQHTRLIGF